MANIINYYPHNLKLKLNNDEYWDFFLNNDAYNYYAFEGASDTDNCIIAKLDLSKESTYDGDFAISDNKYFWDKSYANGYTLNNIGYAGFDNGLLQFRRDKITNKYFLNLYQNSKYTIDDNDVRLKLHKVSGCTLQYDYSAEYDGEALKLNGGFYQGFFKTEDKKYQVLPTKLCNGDNWSLEFVVKKENYTNDKEILNDKYPENKGIFFYIGTRAENKWIYLYDDDISKNNTLDVGDYVDDGEIDVKTYKLNNLLNPNPNDFIGRQEEFETKFIDDYLANKYYDETLYHEECIDDFFLNDYVLMDRKPKMIDEENNEYKELNWCCNYSVENRLIESTKKTIKYTYPCGCKTMTVIKDVEEQKVIEEITLNNGYFSRCNIFGDDYLDLGDVDYITDFIEEDIDISDFDYKIFDEDLSIKIPHQYYFETDNKFLTFDRTIDGFNVYNYTSDSFMRYYGVKNRFNGNLFLLMNRTCTGKTVYDINRLIEEYNEKEYNIYKDIYDNALAFRITDDGRIGYRYYTLDCDSENKTNIREAYSKPNIIENDKWYVINVNITVQQNTMQLRFYVNGFLVFVSDYIRKLNLRKLDDLYEKQESVPYSISIGGGTQGLIETILPNYMINPYRVYPLEEYFAGSFIGKIKSFKFYTCKMDYINIFNNFLGEARKML